MDVLWAADGRALTVREVHEALGGRGLAYTTVMTVLDRLARKQVVVQGREDRAFRYAPRASRAELAAELMHQALSGTTGGDRGEALVAFVGEASATDLEALRKALAALDR